VTGAAEEPSDAGPEPPAEPGERLADLVAEYLTWLEARGYAESTVSARKREVKWLLRWLSDRGVTRPTEVTLPVLERYRVYLYRRRKPDGTPLTWGSQTQKLLAVRGLFRWLALTRRIRSNPASDLELPRKRHRIPKAVLSAQEAELVLAGPDVQHPLGVRDRAILETLYSTGVRRAELAALDLTDVDLTRLVVLVLSGKGGHDRLVPLGERAGRWIDRYLEDVRPLLEVASEPDAVFLTRRGRRITPRRLSDLARRYVDRAGLGKTGACHLFRHTMATLMLEGGADVRHIQEILGHRELSTTALYTHLSIATLQEVHRRTHPARLERSDADREALRSSLAAELLEAAHQEDDGPSAGADLPGTADGPVERPPAGRRARRAPAGGKFT